MKRYMKRYVVFTRNGEKIIVLSKDAPTYSMTATGIQVLQFGYDPQQNFLISEIVGVALDIDQENIPEIKEEQ